ncbi:MAG: PEP-CTERM sorting domain-containing protein [Planctomycetota bacterium]
MTTSDEQRPASPVALSRPERIPAAAVCLAIVLACATSLQAATVVEDIGPFRVSFYGSGDGGSDSGVVGEQDWTVQQRSDVMSAVGAWTEHIDNAAARQIEMHLFWTEMDVYGTNVLGGSSSARMYDGTTIWNVGEYVWKEEAIFTPSTNYDTYIQYDITAAGLSGGWNFGDGDPAGNTIDFQSVITHEIGHSLGFSSSYDPQRKDFGWLGFANQYAGLTDWDKHLIDADGTTPPVGGGRARKFDAKDDPVFWTGAIANDYYGGAVPIYAPDPWAPGSSLSHVDETALPFALMSPFIAAGQSVRSPTALEWKLMADMGWSIVYALGDFNENGKIDAYDIDLLCDNVGNSAYDLDGDLDADEDDLIFLVENLVELTDGRTGTARGDFNLDGYVDGTDLAIFKAGFGLSGDVGWADGNTNCDDVINATDLAIFKANFGFAAPADPVPEPAIALLLALGASSLIRTRRKTLSN